jgi:hypothetical protein
MIFAVLLAEAGFRLQSLCEERVLFPGAGEMYGASELAVRFLFLLVCRRCFKCPLAVEGDFGILERNILQ